MNTTVPGFHLVARTVGFANSLIACTVLLAAMRAQAHHSAELGIQLVATNQVQLFWQPVTGFEQLQQVNSFGQTNFWQTVTNAPSLQSPLLLLLQNATNSQTFYRLANGSQPIAAPTNLPDPSTVVPPAPPNTQLSFASATSFPLLGAKARAIGHDSGNHRAGAGGGVAWPGANAKRLAAARSACVDSQSASVWLHLLAGQRGLRPRRPMGAGW